MKHIERRSPVYKSFRVEGVRGMMDIPKAKEIVQSWDVDLPLDKQPWQIGLIVGASGSGKSTIAQELFPEAYHHESSARPERKALVDEFNRNLQTKEIVEALSSVGLCSPPHWLKPFNHLSNGQKFRAELAMLITSEFQRIVFDEFTSIVDRDVAKVCCKALSKTLRRRHRPQLVAVSCHSDIIDWLQPDWVYEAGSNHFEWRRLRQPPSIELGIYQTDGKAWELFKGHHYLSADIHKSAACYVGVWGDRPVAFTAVLYFPHPKVRNFRREHRTVVLPDFQGAGIGNAMSEAIAELYHQAGNRYISVTSHPAMVWHRSRSPLWRVTKDLSHSSVRGVNCNPASRHPATGRLCARFEYVGKPKKEKTK
jgi:energy-coupling factor transporter ATP-binding protein EcfA2